MKSLVSLWLSLADEYGQLCNTSTVRDCRTVSTRVKAEGLSFLTITLPSFGKAFELSLSKGFIVPGDFLGFKKSSGPLPRFLGGFLERCFDRTTGVIRSDISVDCIEAIRQLCYVYSKLRLPTSDFRTKKAIDKYVQVDEEVAKNESDVAVDDYNRLAVIGSLLFGDSFNAVVHEIHEGALSPKHGPGSTADRKTSNGRFRHTVWPVRLESVFPYLEYALPSCSYYKEQDHVRFLDPEAEIPVKVISVPKTQKTPRIIAIEPSAMQYMQQALSRSLIRQFESPKASRSTRRNLCYSMIGFSDQLPNREMARLGSINGSLATLDLSDASDRVSVRHVTALMSNFPELLEAVLSVRSTKAKVPGHGVIPLAKYASMGSALCFPIEAAVFLAVVFFGICKEESPRSLRNEISRYKGMVRVYGDDIIVPVNMVERVIASLELFGLKVNANKSFWTGKFRESCGGDYYDGEWVTPVRLGHLFPSSHTDASEVVSLVEFRNHLYQKGLWKTAYWLDSRISRVLHGFYPIVESTSPIIGRLCFSGSEPKTRWDRNLHINLVKGYYTHSLSPVDQLDDWPALLKFFLKVGDEPIFGNHLERQGRPLVVNTKLGWKPPR